MANNGVRFIRKGGRVIPIRESNVTPRAVPNTPFQEGVKEVAKAGGLAVGGGLGVAGIAKGVAHFRAKSKVLFKAAGAASSAALKTKLRDKAVLLRYTSSAMRKLKNPALAALGVAAGTLAYAGVSKAIPTQHERDHPVEAGLIKTGAAAAAALAVPAAYYKGIGTSLATGIRYATALKTGRIARLPKLKIKTKYGPTGF